MRAHQPGSTPIDIPETVPNPAYTPAPGPAPAPERAPTKVPEKVPEKVIAPESSGAFFLCAEQNRQLGGESPLFSLMVSGPQGKSEDQPHAKQICSGRGCHTAG